MDLGAVQQEMHWVTWRLDNFHEILHQQQWNFSKMEMCLCRCQPDIEQTQLEYEEESPVASGSYITPPQTSSSQGGEQAVCRSPEPLPIWDPSIAAGSNAENMPPESTVAEEQPEALGSGSRHMGVCQTSVPVQRVQPYTHQMALGTKSQHTACNKLFDRQQR